MRHLLVARLEETTRQLAESNALLATEIADRTSSRGSTEPPAASARGGQEDERRRIARDLHDDLGQRLVALRLTLEASERGRPAAGIPGGARRCWRGSIRVSISWRGNCRPAALDELGLMRVLDTYVTEWSRHAGVRATFHGRPRPVRAVRARSRSQRLPYRAGGAEQRRQARHAPARSTSCWNSAGKRSSCRRRRWRRASIRAAGSETPIGLTGMRERVDAVGGTLDIEPTPEGGTTVRARIPHRGHTVFARGLASRPTRQCHESSRARRTLTPASSE